MMRVAFLHERPCQRQGAIGGMNVLIGRTEKGAIVWVMIRKKRQFIFLRIGLERVG